MEAPPAISSNAPSAIWRSCGCWTLSSPTTKSCATGPAFVTTKATVSPARTVTESGVKRAWSVVLSNTVWPGWRSGAGAAEAEVIGWLIAADASPRVNAKGSGADHQRNHGNSRQVGIFAHTGADRRMQDLRW